MHSITCQQFHWFHTQLCLLSQFFSSPLLVSVASFIFPLNYCLPAKNRDQLGNPVEQIQLVILYSMFALECKKRINVCMIQLPTPTCLKDSEISVKMMQIDAQILQRAESNKCSSLETHFFKY